jgi:hypothetical protein
LQKCITSLEAFDPQKAQKRAPAVLALETAIDKALSLAFGYGTPAYLRYNQAATLDPDPLLQMPRFAAPSCVQLVDQEDTMRRLMKRGANIFQRARSGRSPCSGRAASSLAR